MKTSDTNSQPDVQGEGDYRSDRAYTEAARSFVQSGKVDEAARKAKPATPAEAEEMKRAEKVGESHSKGEDPALKNAPSREP